MVATQVNFGGTSITAYVKSFEIAQAARNKMASATFDVSSKVSSVVSITSNTQVEVWRTLSGTSVTDPDDKIFNGYVESYQLNTGRSRIEALDKLVLAKRTVMNRVYLYTDPEAGKISEIFKDILEDQLTTSLTANCTDSGTNIIIEKFKCLNTDGLDRLRKLAEAINWQFYYDPVNDYVTFEPEGNTENANSLNLSTEILGRLTWEYDKSDLANIIIVKGGNQLVETTQTFNGDGLTDTFTLARKPVSIKVTVGGSVQVVSILNTSAADVYVDREAKNIRFDAGSIPGVGVGNIVVAYSYTRPIIVIREDPVSVAAYGPHDKMFEYNDIVTLNDALDRGNKLLEIYSQPFKTTEIKLANSAISTFGLAAGQTVNVVDSINNIDDDFNILEYTYRYPASYDKIKVGDREVRFDEMQFDILDRLKRQEEINADDQDIAYVVKELGEHMTIKTVQLKKTLQLVNDSFMLGTDKHDIIGTSSLVDTFDSTSANWSSGDFTLSDEAAIYKVGPGSMKVEMDGNTLGNVVSTTFRGDYSSHTGVASGSPTKGVCGLWFYKPTGTTITALTLRIGSSSSDYTEIPYSLFGVHVGYSMITWQDDVFNYLIFDLDSGLAVTVGTPDWTDVDYVQLATTLTSTTDFYIDHMSISSNTKSANLLGDRRTSHLIETLTYSW